MTEEKKQQTLVSPLAEADTQQERIDESHDKSLIDTPEKPPQKQTKGTQTPRPTRKRKRPTNVEMDNRDTVVTMAAIEQQDTKTKDGGITERIEYSSHICYLCSGRIPIKQRTDYKCPKCGNRACSSCLEVTDSLNGVCLFCDRKADRRKVIWDTVALVAIVIVAAIVLYLILMCLLMCLFPEPVR